MLFVRGSRLLQVLSASKSPIPQTSWFSKFGADKNDTRSLPGNNPYSKTEVWCLLNVYCFCAIIKQKNGKLNHYNSGTVCVLEIYTIYISLTPIFASFSFSSTAGTPETLLSNEKSSLNTKWIHVFSSLPHLFFDPFFDFWPIILSCSH